MLALLNELAAQLRQELYRTHRGHVITVFNDTSQAPKSGRH